MRDGLPDESRTTSSRLLLQLISQRSGKPDWNGCNSGLPRRTAFMHSRAAGAVNHTNVCRDGLLIKVLFGTIYFANAECLRNRMFMRSELVFLAGFLSRALRSFTSWNWVHIPAPKAQRLGSLAIRKPFAFDPSGALFHARAVSVMARIPSERKFVGVF